MLSREKKRVFLQGKILSLKVGECAIISSSQGTIRTSTVAAVEYPASDFIMFETRNSVYCVAPARHPMSMMSPTLVNYSMAA